MPKYDALPPNLPPRLLCREAAAAYVCVSPNTFDEMVETGSMPHPRRLRDRRIAWDVRELDVAVDRLPVAAGAPAGDETWSDVDATKAAAIR